MNRYIIPTLCVLLLAACKKDKTPATPPGTTTTYEMDMRTENPLDFPVNIKVYPGYADYLDNKNVLSEWRLEPYSSGHITLQKFKATDTFYFDMYSDDGTHTNWGNYRYFDSSYFIYRTAADILEGGGFNMISYMQHTGNLRPTFFTPNSRSSTWKAIDKFDNSWYSRWAALEAHERFYELTIHKDMHYTIRRQASDMSYTTVENKIIFIPQAEPFLSVITLAGFPGGSPDRWVRGTKRHPLDNIPCNDTVVLDDEGDLWLMVRE